MFIRNPLITGFRTGGGLEGNVVGTLEAWRAFTLDNSIVFWSYIGRFNRLITVNGEKCIDPSPRVWCADILILLRGKGENLLHVYHKWRIIPFWNFVWWRLVIHLPKGRKRAAATATSRITISPWLESSRTSPHPHPRRRPRARSCYFPRGRWM
jgi:hypothetical protein